MIFIAWTFLISHSRDREVLRLPARELDALDAPGEVDDHAVAGGRRAVDRLVADPLLAQRLDRAGDVLGAHVGDRALDRDLGKVAELDLRIDLEDRRELELIGSLGVGSGLDSRVTGDAQ